MDYWEARKAIARIIPGKTLLAYFPKPELGVREKGRKKNYQQYDLLDGKFYQQERLLSSEEIGSFINISVRAMACPMPLNMDIYDGLYCPYSCKYCFSNAFRASLYTAFFDNSKAVGIRNCNPDIYKKRMDRLLRSRGREVNDNRPVNKAVSLNIPLRFGIQFEDFLPLEVKRGVALQMLKYLADVGYPVMLNTKSDVVGRDEYAEALASNSGKAAVHMTLISSNNRILKMLEPGAPPYERRLNAMKNLALAGVRVVARIEPFMWLLNDDPEDVQQYMSDLKSAGIRYLTFDNYSYSPTARNSGILSDFHNAGIDFERIFTAVSEVQPIGSFLLGKFMDLFKKEGFDVSTFDMGNVPTNDQHVCCSVSDFFTESGFNYGSTVEACRYIVSRKGSVVSWKDFESEVEKNGGFLSLPLKSAVHHLWNMDLLSKNAYGHSWGRGIIPVGYDEWGTLWKYEPSSDYREDLIRRLLYGRRI